MSEFSFQEFSRQSPKGILFNYGMLLYKLVKSFWVFIPIFFSKSIDDKMGYLLLLIGGLIVLILIVATVQFLYFKYKIEGDQFILKQGVIFKKKTAIPIERIQSVNFKQNIVHQLINVTQVEIQTAGAKDVEVSIKAVSREVAEALKQKLQTSQGDSEHELVQEATSSLRLIYSLSVMELLKVSFSENHLRSFFWILALTFSFGYQLEDIVEEWNFADEMIQFVVLNKEEITDSLLGLFLLLVVGVVISVSVSFFRVFFRHFDQKVVYNNDGIQVSEGLFTRRQDVLKIQKIQYAVLITNPVKKAFGIGTIRIKQAGSGKVKKMKLVELVGVKEQFQKELTELFFDYGEDSNFLRFGPNSYYLFQMFVRSAFFAMLVNAVFYFNSFAVIEFFVLNSVLLPFSVFLVFLKYKKTYFNFQEGKLIVGDGKISTVTTFIEYYKTQNIKLVQSLIQKKRGVATLKLQTASGVIKLRCLSLKDALTIQEILVKETENNKRDWI